SRVCHQGTVYTASFPVLPFLLEASTSWPPASRVMPLSLAADIVSSNNAVGVHDTAAFRPVIDALHDLALETISSSALPQADLIYLLHATLALSGDTLWGRQFDRLAEGEFNGVCGTCGATLFLVIGGH